MEVKTHETEDFLKLLCKLPDEVLRIIFDYLPPGFLALLQQSENEWVREICLQINVSDFQQLQSISPELLIHFLKPRRLTITEMYTDNLLCVSRWQFQAELLRCQCLCILSIRNCRVKFASVWLLLHTLHNIRDFSWSTECEDISQNQLPCVKSGSRLDKLSLDVHSISVFILFLDRLSFCLNQLTTLGLNFFTSEIRSDTEETIVNAFCFAPIPGVSNFYSIPSLPNLDSLLVMVPYSSHYISVLFRQERCINMLLMTILRNRDPTKPWKSLWIPSCFSSVVKNKAKVTSDAKLMCLMQETEVDQFLSAVEGELVAEALGVYVRYLDSRNISVISKCLRMHLKKLVFSALLHTSEDVTAFRSFLYESKYLTDLDLRGVHKGTQDKISLCFFIKELKYLRRLCLSVCAITNHSRVKSDRCIHGMNDNDCFVCRLHFPHLIPRVDAHHSFREMIKSCSCVEEFVLSPCVHECRNGTVYKDETLEPVHNWLQLKHLRLFMLHKISLCSFLNKVGQSCKNFRSLQLIFCGPETGCNFSIGFESFFKQSQSLVHLKIARKNITCDFISFWSVLQLAKNLESVCISTDFGQHADLKSIIECVKKLTKLTTFHFYCKGTWKKTLHKIISEIISKRSGRPTDEVDVIVDKAFRAAEPLCPSDWCCRNVLF